MDEYSKGSNSSNLEIDGDDESENGLSFLTRECAHAHERVIAITAFSLGRLVGRLVGSVVNFRACAVNEF